MTKKKLKAPQKAFTVTLERLVRYETVVEVSAVTADEARKEASRIMESPAGQVRPWEEHLVVEDARVQEGLRS